MRRTALILAPRLLLVAAWYAIALSGLVNPSPMPTPHQVAFARNGLSTERRSYLAAGGLGFFIGNGRLNYRPETIFETFYSIGVSKNFWLSFDWQHIRNSAYNSDRGPVNVGTLRLHTEF